MASKTIDGYRTQEKGEDRELTAYLGRHIAALLSPEPEPRPPCPRCSSTNIRLDGYRSRMGGYRLPAYLCTTCGFHYCRLQGTPLDGRLLDKIDAFLPLLSQPLTLVEAAQMVGKITVQISELVKVFRSWLLELDPTGAWENRVRLGGRRTEVRATFLPVAETGVTEDVALTQRLMSAYDDLYGGTGTLPGCPWCESPNTFEVAAHPSRRLPAFECRRCSRVFNRRSGTPFSRTRMTSAKRMRPLIRYLSLPLPYSQVGDILGCDETHIRVWRDKFAQWADQLERDDSLSRRFRLGVEPTQETPCLYCGRTGTAERNSQPAWHCTGCGRLFSMRRELVDRDGCLEIVGAMDHEFGAGASGDQGAANQTVCF